ncbi:SDR family oxidoreductase [Haloechinothrix sp. LS1_15]|uniref:SDR family NAD(P)-dependent oxidoreductase n=1 Tax=Haloechinothrix sp. LS1_15 TaxID=2652248 RepID=UPI0029443900|nr:SDR family oxidoreductase [Haloechinothrix sp. LS1_15]MDV6011956.1 SDR family oxidoreductase [Haloechinothrix sp. LS1_15]
MAKIAVITGGTAGIGLACAEAFLADGDTVVISGRSAERGSKALAGLDAGARARYIPCDVTDPAQVRELIEETVTEYRRIDVLVNNAGGVIDQGRPLSELDEDNLDRAFTLNVNSAFWACRAALRHMLPRGYGRIINMASIAGKIGIPGLIGYSTTKHALIGFTKTLAKETTTRGVTVNAVCPGITDTELVEREAKAPIEAAGFDFGQLAARLTGDLGRIIDPAEVAAIVRTLASPQCAAISGTTINIDGGYTQF